MKSRDLIGRKIVAVELHPFDDGKGGKANDPVLVLDNGRRLTFFVQETDVGEYGVKLILSAPADRRTNQAVTA